MVSVDTDTNLLGCYGSLSGNRRSRSGSCRGSGSRGSVLFLFLLVVVLVEGGMKFCRCRWWGVDHGHLFSRRWWWRVSHQRALTNRPQHATTSTATTSTATTSTATRIATSTAERERGSRWAGAASATESTTVPTAAAKRTTKRTAKRTAARASVSYHHVAARELFQLIRMMLLQLGEAPLLVNDALALLLKERKEAARKK
jgi:hypothetical protein